MSLFAIGDLHMSGGDDKPMDVFGPQWDRHFFHIRENWQQLVTAEDTVLIPGDISWAMQLEAARADLEEIANSFDGVDKSYAIQSGREVRIMVKPEDITDEGIKVMAREIAKRIEEQMEYPGQIRVNVIRETRSTEYAK